MKTKIITMAFIAITSITSQLIAQEAAAKSAGYDLKKNVKCRVIPSEAGYSIVFEYNAKSPTDVAIDQSSGKKGYDYYKASSSYNVSASDNSVTEVKSPRDAASGMASGKRQHKPLTITKEVDKSSPVIFESVSNPGTIADAPAEMKSGGGAGKVSMQDMSITKTCAGKTTKFLVVDGEVEIPTGDCPNGNCTLTLDWSWGANNAGSTEIGSQGMDGVSRSSVNFLMQIEDGVCTAMAINEKGLPGEKKPKKTKTNSPK